MENKIDENNMKSESLRIGNFTMSAGRQLKIITPEILSDFHGKLIVLHPIPLSEQWLLDLPNYKSMQHCYNGGILNVNKNLFLKIRKFQGTWNIYLKTKVGENSYTLLEIIDAKVHQLQNLYYSLTNKELK